MKKICSLALSIILLSKIFGQEQQISIKQMIWGPDYQVYLTLSNDSGYLYAIDQLYHANHEIDFNRNSEFVYFPVKFQQSYIDSLVENMSSKEEFTVEKPRNPQIRRITLWNAVGESIGGGWAHFINCMAFVLESKQLELTAPLLTRPNSNWKPKPMTDTYKRTRKWKYFIPITQKQAQKEYKIRLKRNQLGDLQSIPIAYIQLFMNTSDRQYQKLILSKNYNTIARIDLVKLMLGSPYLGEDQINYIKSRVLQSIASYNRSHIPSVLIFDKYEAAVAMSLDGLGYKTEKIVFKEQEKLSEEEVRQRCLIINGIISLINETNTKAFKNRLAEIYKQKE